MGRRAAAPTSPGLYLAGLLYCANYGGRMVGGPPRPGKQADGTRRLEYVCGGHIKACATGKRAECKCLRTGVYQDVVEGYLTRYPEEGGKRVEALTTALNVGERVLEKLNGLVEGDACRAYGETFLRRLRYVQEHDPAGYAEMWADLPEGQDVDLGTAVEHYRRCFDPATVQAELAQLEVQHTTLTKAWADLPTPRAKEKARAELAQLEARIAGLEQRQQSLADALERRWTPLLTRRRDLDSVQGRPMPCVPPPARPCGGVPRRSGPWFSGWSWPLSPLGSEAGRAAPVHD